MTENIVCFDVETTGLSQKEDHIIQLSLVKFNSGTFEEIDSRNWYILPKGNFKIDPIAQSIHGITKEFILENGVRLDTVFEDLQRFIQGCDMLSYNGNRFDVGFLYEDLREYGLELKYENKYYDAYTIETLRNPKDLSTIYKKYTGKNLEGAHDSLNDVRATIEVFKHQLQENTEDVENIEEFNILSPEGSVCEKANNIVFARGKYRDVMVVDVCKKDPSYIRWLFNNCSNMTKEVIKKEWQRYKEANV